MKKAAGPEPRPEIETLMSKRTMVLSVLSWSRGNVK
jgi:hypothetical protein